MVGVALVAAVLGGIVTLRQRRDHAEAMEAYHGARFFDAMQPLPDPEDWPSLKPWAEYHLAMETKWRQAARRPWLPFVPDPPGPR